MAVMVRLRTPGGSGIGRLTASTVKSSAIFVPAACASTAFSTEVPSVSQILPPVLVDDLLEPRFVERDARRVFRLDNAVAEHHQHVAHLERERARRVGRLLEHAQGHAALA